MKQQSLKAAFFGKLAAPKADPAAAPAPAAAAAPTPAPTPAAVTAATGEAGPSPKRPRTAGATDAPSAAVKPMAVDTPAETAPTPAMAASADAGAGTADTWTAGQPVPFAALVNSLELIEAISSRLKITDILSDLFRRIIAWTPNDLRYAVYLCTNRLSPAYEGLELGIGESLLIKAIAASTGRTPAHVKTEYETVGDLGTVAQSSRSNQRTMFRPARLTMATVFKTLTEIAQTSGNASMQKKVDKIQNLLVACQGNEAKYLIRMLEGKLRIGLAEQTVLVAIAQAFVLSEIHPPTKAVTIDKNAPLAESVQKAALIVKTVYSELPNYDRILPVALTEGLQALPKHCSLTAGIPVKPMLAHPTKSISEVLDRFENMRFTCEYKYDGERNQIHKLENGQVMIFSRNSENLTGKYPDLVHRVSSAAKSGVQSFILDCESVAWDREAKHILPFQVLSTRKRKEVNAEDVKVQVCLFAFDLLFLNGRSLLREPLKVRRELLYECFQEVEGEFSFAKAIDSTTTEEIETFLYEAIQGHCEGLMVKTLEVEATYEPAKRSHNWLKVKKDYLEGMGDSVDVVVLGAYFGKGKRTGVYGGFLLACYDEESESFQSLCKIGTGFSDEALETHHTFFKDHTIPKPKPYYKFDATLACDVWFDTAQVWEIKAADLSLSPKHLAAVGQIDPNRGISLRFPRFLRIREDKSAEQATSSEQIAEMYRKQQLNTAKSSDAAADDDEY